MKKILLATATAAMLTSTTTFAAAETFYIKANAGMDKFTQTKFGKAKLKSQNSGLAGLGFGYSIMDNVRAELMFDHYFNAHYKSSYTYKGKNITDSHTGKLKLDINTIMLNGFVDVYTTGPVTIFAGAGVGMAIINGKLTGKSIATNNATGTKVEEEPFDVKVKNTKNFSYAGYLGASTEVAPGVKAELSYSFKGMGSISKTKDGQKVRGSKPTIQGHHVLAGIRFDL